jgi:hypothetical protein
MIKIKVDSHYAKTTRYRIKFALFPPYLAIPLADKLK